MNDINLNKIISTYITDPLNPQNIFFTQFNVSTNEIIPCSLCQYYKIDGTTTTLKITSYSFIPTIQGTSIEGQHLTGNKLSLIGVIDVNIIFTCNSNKYSNYIFKKSIPFSTFIIVPRQICNKDLLNLGYLIEDTEALIISSNNLFINILVFLQYQDFL